MCWEQSRLKRTMATSRSEATTTLTNPDHLTARTRRIHCDRRTRRRPDYRPALSLRTTPEENCFPLTLSFRNGPTHRGRWDRRTFTERSISSAVGHWVREWPPRSGARLPPLSAALCWSRWSGRRLRGRAEAPGHRPWRPPCRGTSRCGRCWRKLPLSPTTPTARSASDWTTRKLRRNLFSLRHAGRSVVSARRVPHFLAAAGSIFIRAVWAA
jgi:hypothetical protein